MNPIEQLASKIQAMPPELRWLSAQQDIIMGVGTPPHRGRGGMLADRFVEWTDLLRIDRTLAAVVTLTLSLLLYCKQFRVKSGSMPKTAIFIGISALREPPLVEEFERLCACPASRLDERNLATFYAFQRVGSIAIAGEWARLWLEIWSKLHRSRIGIGLDRRLQLSFLLRNGHKFIYLRAWFRKYLKSRDSDLPIGFSAASYTASAAIAMGARAIYFQHGFQRRSIVYPDFAEFYCFNRFEGEHFQARLPKSKVVIRPEPLDLVQMDRLLVVAGVYGKIETFELSRSVIQWALNRGIPVIVRPHPAEHTDYWKQWADVPGIRIDEERCDFDAFLLKVRPRLVVTWFSTTLFDALKRGSVPITLSENVADAGDVVFPFQRMALRWPDERNVIERLVDDPVACTELVNQKYSDATVPSTPGVKLAVG